MSSEITSSLAPEMERRVRPRLIQTSRTEGNEAPASDRYDFAGLVQSSPELAPWILPHRDGGETIDFRNPSAVIALNRALLKFHYGVQWDLPDGRLCPTIPSRADYLDQIARLLTEDSPEQRAPSGERVRILDVGVGANAVYPLIGHAKHGWRFVGTEIDRESREWARQLVRVNGVASTAIEIREQPLAEDILTGAISANERFQAAICNPPFYDSKASADAAKIPRSRAARERAQGQAKRAFSGSDQELWCEGGEQGFLSRMLAQSVERPKLCVWFSSLVSRVGSLAVLQQKLSSLRAVDVRTFAQVHGNKHSRILAWTFLSTEQRRERLANQ